MEGRIEGPLLDQEHVIRPSLDALGDEEAVGRTREKRPQDQEIERAPKQIASRRR